MRKHRLSGFGVILATAILLLLVPGVASSRSDSARLQSGTQKFFLHIDTSEGSGVGTIEHTLSVVDRLDEGSTTGLDDGLLNEVFIVTGIQDPATTQWPSADGMPLRLSTSTAVTGVIALEAFWVGILDDTGIHAGGGAATLELQLEGELLSGKKVEIGEQTFDYLVTPAQETYLLEVEIQPPTDLHGKRLSSITLTTLVRGPSVMSGTFELEDPASFIEIPTLKMRARGPT